MTTGDARFRDGAGAVEHAFEGRVQMAYGQMYVDGSAGEPSTDLSEAFAGQVNGLCGAAEAHHLFLITGRHTGTIDLTVDILDAPPQMDETWEDIVEASFEATGDEVHLMEWDGNGYPLPFPMPGAYRVRYSARNMDAARDDEYTREADAAPTDSYRLQFWPAPITADAIVKQTSESAAYWHDYAQQLPPPPPAAERAEANRAAQEQDRLQQDEAMRPSADAFWGDRPPTERQREVGGNVLGLVALDRRLVDAMTDTSPEVQRNIARWAAQWAYDQAGLSQLPWIEPALAAMHAGTALPAPFDDFGRSFDALFADPAAPHVVVNGPEGGVANRLQSAMALPALMATTANDPLQAAFDAVHCAVVTVGTRYPDLFAEIRSRFLPTT